MNATQSTRGCALFQSVSAIPWAPCRSTVTALTASATKPRANVCVFLMWSGRTVTAVRPTPGSWPAGLGVTPATAMLLIPSGHLVMRWGAVAGVRPSWHKERCLYESRWQLFGALVPVRERKAPSPVVTAFLATGHTAWQTQLRPDVSHHLSPQLGHNWAWRPHLIQP